ncbi:MAG: hypothetical protein CMA63_06930 [Euryarchaeota archaeon]|nr:hypothetical protein [Euryarchaeota archaeon]|tara:strand:+ start:6336 stop:6824 length:489 start_codon:yes stop_codon:yes gene_type:complete
MDALTEAMFWFSSVWILPFWIMMWFMPRHEVTKRFVGDLRWSLVPLLIPYAIVGLPHAPDILFTFASQMPTPESVVALFAEDDVVVLGWLHFLAFDLFLGRYIWLRMVAMNRPLYVSTPVLILCTMMAPLGVLVGLIATRGLNESQTFAFHDIEMSELDSTA